MIKLSDHYRWAMVEAQSRVSHPITRSWQFEDLYSTVSGIWLVALSANHIKDKEILDRYLEYIDYLSDKTQAIMTLSLALNKLRAGDILLQKREKINGIGYTGPVYYLHPLTKELLTRLRDEEGAVYGEERKASFQKNDIIRNDWIIEKRR